MKNVVNRTLVWVKKNVIYHLKSIMQRKGFESRDGEWTEGEASIEHPFSIHSASIGHPLRAGGKQVASSLLRSWKYAATLTLLLTLSVGQMWGWTISSAKVYFDNTNSAYDCGVRFVIEKSDGCCVKSMSLISGTNNLYYWTGTWGDGAVSNLRFASASYTTDWYGWWSNVGNVPTLASAESFCSYTNTYGADVNNTYRLFNAASGSTGANVTKTDLTSYTALNYTQTVYRYVSENGGTPAASTANIATISIATKYLSAAATTGNHNVSIASGNSSNNTTAARTATVTMTATNISDGYTFLGWYSAGTGGSLLESSTTYTYQATAAKSVYARFSHETTHTVNITYKCGSTTVSTATSQAIGQVTASSITAPTVAGYTFSGWTLGNGISNQSANISANPISVKTKSTGTYTMQANYTEDLSSPWIVAGGNKIVTTGTTWRTTPDAYNKMLKKTGHSTENVAYFTVPISTACTGDNNGDYQFKIYNTSTSKWYCLAADGSSYYLLKDEDGTEKSLSESGKNIELRAYITGDYEFKLDYSTSTPKLTVTWPDYNQIRFYSAQSGGSTTNTYNFENTGTSTWTKSVNLTKGTTYWFKIIEHSDFFSNSGTMTRTNCSNWTMDGTANNCGITADVTGSYTFSYVPSTKKLTVTYPTAYTVTYGKGTGGSTISASATSAGGTFSSGALVAAGDVVTFSQTPASGYTFKGWYTTKTGSTSAGVSNDQLTINTNKTVWAQYTPNQYTVHFNNNGGTGATPDDITVTYGAAYGTLPAGPTPPGVNQFAGWYTAQTGGTRVTAETLVSTASEHTLWARFESTFTVTVQYKCGDDVLRPQITTHASETSVAATIIAPNIVGYAFVNWTGSNATFADATNDTTTVNVTSATTIVANYTAVPMVCFKNNLDWDDVYVTFDCYWKEVDGKQVPGNNGKPYYKMEQLGQTDIFYCVIPSEYTANNYANWKGNIAFDNKGTFGYPTTTHLGTYDPFWKGEFTSRGDFDPNATMFIPYKGDKETRNAGTYYPTGCWLQYNTTYSGYKVNIWDAVNGNSGSQLNYPGTELRAETAGGFEFKASVYLSNSASARGVKLYKDKTKNSNEIWYTNVNNEANTITSATTTLPWSFVGAGSEENWQRCRILPEVSGDYIFTVSFATGRPMVNIEYPVTTGDFRLVYKDRATWNNTHDASWKQISPVFKHKANRVDTASFFISHGSSPTLALEKCTKIEGGVETWTQQGSNISLSSISSKGVYNFTVTQNNDASSATAAYLGEYSGNYYIRTDASDGGWGSYSKGSNNLTYSEYSLTHGGDFGPYSHYFMRHVDNGQNIKFIIANDYNPCLTDTLVNDTIVNEWISSEANVRFMWYNGSNKIGRAYISGSSIVSDRFLVLEGDTHLYDENGHNLSGTYQIAGLNANEMKFFDDQNWIYETTVQANPLERVKLSAKFNNKVQYFYGAPGTRTDATTHQLIGGSGSGKYKMRVVYDFKTNRLLAAWLPDGDITTEFTIDADVMIIRYHQQDAQQITFTSGSKLKEVKTVYGAMKFNKYRLNNQSEESGHADLGISQYERDLFFISFPFDVKLNDVFGFGNYGKHWIIEYYDGKGRAEKGFWADSPTNWKFVTTDMKDSYTLKANEGYVLALDLDKLTLESSVWNYGVENVYLYFPSTANVNDIEATSRTITIDQTGYQCTIDRRTNKNVPDVNKDRRVADSYWHLIGVPSYANASNSTSSTWTGTVPDLDPANWTTKAPFVYDWNASTNKCGVISTTSSTFKPMRAYLTQYAKPTIEWSSVNATPQSVAARRSIQHVSNYEFRLELQYDGQEADRTFVSLREDEEVTNDFDFSFDLCKELYGGFMPATQIYTIIGADIPAAGNCLPLALEQETSVPVGVKAKTAGEYTFAMPDGTEGLSVTLVDNITGTHTNLALGDYTVELEAGTYDNRFMLVIDPRTTTTSVETVGAEGKDAPRKVFINGLMYIQRGNALYDTTGRKVE